MTPVEAPALVIRVEFEAAPLVYVDALHESDRARLDEWIGAHPDYAELVARALDLGGEARAA